MTEPVSPLKGVGATLELMGIAGRNLQALAAAQQQMLQSLAVLASEQAQLTKAMLSQMQANAPDPANMGANIDKLKTALQESQASMNTLSELMARGAGEAATTLQDRFYAALDELKAIMPAAPGAKAKP
jgi:hypothetical protein